ncbi:MAG: hypothetical protein IPM26_17235 [Saprospiraceae bacterium]|nr:hypothetical protein [Saprospiraceae bacterium]
MPLTIAFAGRFSQTFRTLSFEYQLVLGGEKLGVGSRRDGALYSYPDHESQTLGIIDGIGQIIATRECDVVIRIFPAEAYISLISIRSS